MTGVGAGNNRETGGVGSGRGVVQGASRVLLPTDPAVRYHGFTAAAQVTSGVSRVTCLLRLSSTSEPSRGASAERSETGTSMCRTLYPLSGVL
jgi:hypothetical protein